MAKRNTLEELKLKKKIDVVCKEFCSFMKIATIPDYNLLVVQQTGTTIAEEKYERGRYNLYVSNILDTYYKDLAKGLVFHELTHIIDEEELCNKYNYLHTERNRPYVYKEIHAEQIRTLYLLGASDLDDIENLHKDNCSFFWVDRRLYKIFDYLQLAKRGLVNDIDAIKEAYIKGQKFSKEEFNNILSRVFGYIGVASIYVRYCADEDVDELRIDEICQFYGCDLDDVYDKVMELPIGCHSQEYIEYLGDIRIKIIVKFQRIIAF